MFAGSTPVPRITLLVFVKTFLVDFLDLFVFHLIRSKYAILHLININFVETDIDK